MNIQAKLVWVMGLAFGVSAWATAQPSVVAEHDGKGGVGFEFVADSNSPTASLGIEIALRETAKGAKVPEDCLVAPRGFSALCNIDGLTFKAVVYSMNPDATLPSSQLGRVQLPVGAISIAKSGELEGLVVKSYDGMAKLQSSEVLSAARSGDRSRPVTSER